MADIIPRELTLVCEWTWCMYNDIKESDERGVCQCTEKSYIQGNKKYIYAYTYKNQIKTKGGGS